MSKAKEQSFSDDLIEIFTGLPWWVPLTLATAAFFGIEPLGRAVADEAWAGIWPTVRMLVVFVLLGTGVAGQIARYRRRGRLAGTKDLGHLLTMNWREFEQLCGDLYSRKGYAVTPTADGADGGVDLVLERGGERIFVQCKHYGADRKVGVARVRELYGVMNRDRATGGVLITTGVFTKEALDFARGTEVELVSGSSLLKMLRESESKPAANTRGTSPAQDTAPDIVRGGQPTFMTSPTLAQRVSVQDASRASRVGAPWTSEEEARMVALFRADRSISSIAGELERKPGGIRARLQKLGLVDA